MPRTLKELEAEALQLEPEAREQLARRLLLTLQPARRPRAVGTDAHPVDQVYGVLGLDTGADELIEAMRGR